jgi:hypothetical protein
MEILRPDLWGELNSNDWPILYERYRHFITFLNPRKMKCIEEILLYNSGTPVDYIIYDLGEFKQQLYVYDSDDKKLEFHHFPDPQKISKYLIKIEFPIWRKLNPEEYRTISLHYYNEIPSYSGFFGLFGIPLDLAKNSYIYFEKPNEYHTVFNFFKSVKKNPEIADLKYLKHTDHTFSDDELDIIESEIKVQIVGKNITKSKRLIVTISHELYEEQEIWFQVAGYFAGVSSAFILTELILILINHGGIVKFLNFIPTIIPLEVASISSLIIVKGWIFTKDMDWILNDINNANGNYYTYDRLYIALILICIIEIVITISICMFEVMS